MFRSDVVCVGLPKNFGRWSISITAVLYYVDHTIMLFKRKEEEEMIMISGDRSTTRR